MPSGNWRLALHAATALATSHSMEVSVPAYQIKCPAVSNCCLCQGFNQCLFQPAQCGAAAVARCSVRRLGRLAMPLPVALLHITRCGCTQFGLRVNQKPARPQLGVHQPTSCRQLLILYCRLQSQCAQPPCDMACTGTRPQVLSCGTTTPDSVTVLLQCDSGYHTGFKPASVVL